MWGLESSSLSVPALNAPALTSSVAPRANASSAPSIGRTVGAGGRLVALDEDEVWCFLKCASVGAGRRHGPRRGPNSGMAEADWKP